MPHLHGAFLLHLKQFNPLDTGGTNYLNKKILHAYFLF